MTEAPVGLGHKIFRDLDGSGGVRCQLESLTGGRTDHFSNMFSRPWIVGWLLLIYSFRFRSAFQPRCRNWFSQLHFTLFSRSTASV